MILIKCNLAILHFYICESLMGAKNGNAVTLERLAVAKQGI